MKQMQPSDIPHCSQPYGRSSSALWTDSAASLSSAAYATSAVADGAASIIGAGVRCTREIGPAKPEAAEKRRDSIVMCGLRRGAGGGQRAQWQRAARLPRSANLVVSLLEAYSPDSSQRIRARVTTLCEELLTETAFLQKELL